MPLGIQREDQSRFKLALASTRPFSRGVRLGTSAGSDIPATAPLCPVIFLRTPRIRILLKYSSYRTGSVGNRPHRAAYQSSPIYASAPRRVRVHVPEINFTHTSSRFRVLHSARFHDELGNRSGYLCAQTRYAFASQFRNRTALVRRTLEEARRADKTWTT